MGGENPQPLRVPPELSHVLKQARKFLLGLKFQISHFLILPLSNDSFR